MFCLEYNIWGDERRKPVLEVSWVLVEERFLDYLVHR